MFESIKRFFSADMHEPELAKEKKIENFDSPEKIFEYFKAVTGMNFNKKEEITKSKIINYCKRNEIYSFDELYQKITTSKDAMQKLIDYLTVNETFFYREIDQVELLCEIAKRSHENFSILCAPCATGEEVYTIIISLLESGVSPHKINIVGIDINATAIEMAKEGSYSSRSLNKLSESLIERYFTKKDDKFEIKNELKRMATFMQMNVFDEKLKNIGKFDYIFSRNMFIYFNEEERRKATNAFCSLLKEHNGYMFFGHADKVEKTECLIEHHIGRTKLYIRA